MAEKVPQSFANHARLVPAYHYVAMPILLANLIWSIRRLFDAVTVDTVLALLVAVALVIVALFARVFALTVQDRVIRLEMGLRLQGLLPESEHARIAELTRNQFVSLRFASDAELPDLFRQVLDEKLDDRKAIKQRIREWTADDLRA